MTQKSRILFALALALTIVLRRFNETLSGFVSLSFVGAVLTFPGLWILIIWQGARASEGLRPFWIPSLSIFFLLFVYLLVDVVPYRVFGWDPPAGFPLAIAATLAACLFWRVQALGLNNETEKIYRSVRAPLFIYLTVVLACYLVVTLGVQPFSEMDYGTISARRTFFSIRTHDNYFQFINGIAISTHRPFEDFYRNGRLVYNYVDREMFPGVLYATINYIVRGFSFQWRNAFVIYEQMTIWLGALIVFPLYTLAQRFFPRVNPRTLLAVLFCNQFILVNTYFAWFKMPGAAFFLMGLCLVLSTPTAIQSWLGAGVLWGLAANFHASAALAYPFAILYLLWTYRGQLSARFCFFAFSGLSGFFGLLYLPWTLVK